MRTSILTSFATLAIVSIGNAIPVEPEVGEGTITRITSSGRIETVPMDFSQEDMDLMVRHLDGGDRSIYKREQNRYLEFDSNDAGDKRRLDKLEGAWKDSIHMASIVYSTWKDAVESGIVGHYFAEADFDKVKKIFENVWGHDDDKGSENLGAVIWRNTDFTKNTRGCTPKGQEETGKEVTLAYLGTLRLADGRRAGLGHVCEQGYDFPLINDVACNSLGDTVSTLLDLIGGIFIHEYMHFDVIGGDVIGPGVRIIDAKKKNEKGEDVSIGYGPLAVRKLTDAEKLLNADNYRWLALEQFWHITCVKDFSPPRDSRDEEEDQCGKGTCVLQ